MGTLSTEGATGVVQYERQVRLVVISGVALVRMALRQLLNEEPGLAVVGEAASWGEGVRVAARTRPDIIIVETSHHDVFGMKLQEIHSVSPQTRAIILSDEGPGQTVFDAAAAGVWGYLPRDVSQPELVRAVRGINEGKVAVGCYLSPEDFVRLGALRTRNDAAPLSLSPKERKVMQGMAQGYTDEQIARTLGLSVPTVKTHVRSILKKTGSRNRAGAIAAGFRTGLLP